MGMPGFSVTQPLSAAVGSESGRYLGLMGVHALSRVGDSHGSSTAVNGTNSSTLY